MSAEGSITRRLNRLVDELSDEIKSYSYTKKAVEEKLNLLELVTHTDCMQSRVPSVRAEVYRMLNALKLSYEKNMPPDYYRQLVNAIDLPDGEVFERRMFEFMYKNFEQYPTPSDYMRRLVKRLSNTADGWGAQPLRLQILKQFIKYGDYLREARYGGRLEIIKYVKEKIDRAPTDDDVCDYLDDGVFDRLKDATKAQKKPEGKFGLLKLADDLAAGKFRTGGAAKRGLYLFAMAYDMTYAQGDPVTDIEKNLFRDYYADNLMRYLSADYRAGDYEAAPSGQGINYKNFAEMIYLYFINQNLSSREKIKQSARMIDDVQAEYLAVNDSNNTKFYRDYGDVFDRAPEEFKEYILDNYDCSTDMIDPKTGRHYNIGALQVRSEQYSAQATLEELTKKLSKKINLADCNYGLSFNSVRGLDAQAVDDPIKFDAFQKIIGDIDRLLKDDRVFAPQNVNRTAILVVFYYFYNEARNKDSGRRWKDFADHFDRFKHEADYWLERALYQPLDVKNIFDMSAAFSSYVHLNF